MENKTIIPKEQFVKKIKAFIKQIDTPKTTSVIGGKKNVK